MQVAAPCEMPNSASLTLLLLFEEQDLVHEHGAAYEAYRHAVPMLLLRRGRPRAPEDAVV